MEKKYSGDIYTQLLLAQEEFPTIVKDLKNPHFKNMYASLPSILNTVLPSLRKYGILLSSSILPGDGNILEIKLIHAETGTFVSSCVRLLNMTDMQKWGGSITYGTRYALLSILGISPDLDLDDGNDICDIKKEVKPSIKEAANTSKERDELLSKILALWEMKSNDAITSDETRSSRILDAINSNFKNINDESLLRMKSWLIQL